jgi:predicted PurR-regulated permease PerM
MGENKIEKVEISRRTIVFTVLLLASLWLVYYIKDIILEIFVSLLIMSILNPTVKSFSKLKIPRTLAIVIVYLLMFGVVGTTIAALIPSLINQTSKFVSAIPEYLSNFGIFGPYSEQVLGQIIAQVGTFPSQFAKVLLSVFSNVLGVVTVLIFAFYLLVAREKLDDQLEYLFGSKKSKEIDRLIKILELKMGGWARGQLALMLLIWGATYIGLFLLGMPFALPLSILAGLLEIIPIIGPAISAVPSVIIGFGISPIVGFAVAALYFLIQQLENYLFVPKVMEKSVGVNPMVTLLALAIGFRLAGMVGILISVPVLITIQTIVSEYLVTEKPQTDN